MKATYLIKLDPKALESKLNEFVPDLAKLRDIAGKFVNEAKKADMKISDKISLDKASEAQLGMIINNLLKDFETAQKKTDVVTNLENEFQAIKDANNAKKAEFKKLVLDLIQEAKNQEISIPKALNEQQITKTPPIGIMPEALIPKITELVKQFSIGKNTGLALDKTGLAQEYKLIAIIDDINNGKLPIYRYKELVLENLYEEETLTEKTESPVTLRSSKTFLAYALPKLNNPESFLQNFKEQLGEEQFNLYMETPILIKGKEDAIDIARLYGVPYGKLNELELKVLGNEKKEVLEPYLPKKTDKKNKEVNFVNIDTHNISSHKSADESHVGAFKLMLENTKALSGVKAEYSEFHKTNERPRRVDIIRNIDLDNFVEQQPVTPTRSGSLIRNCSKQVIITYFDLLNRFNCSIRLSSAS